MIMIVLLSFLACGSDAEKSNFPSCDEVETPIGAEEQTSLGFTPQEKANEQPLSHTVGLEWEDGTVDCLHYTLQLDPETARDVASTPAPIEGSGPVPAIDPECSDYVAIDGYLSMGTPDGEIDEEISITVIYEIDSETGEVAARFTVHQSELNGSYDPSAGDETAKYIINGSIENGHLSGELIIQTTSTNGELALAENTYLAEWGQVDPPAECAEDNE